MLLEDELLELLRSLRLRHLLFQLSSGGDVLLCAGQFRMPSKDLRMLLYPLKGCISEDIIVQSLHESLHHAIEHDVC